MANWVNGHISPCGTDEQIAEVTQYIEENYSYIINNTYRNKDIKGDIGIHAKDAAHAMGMTCALEENFRNNDFHLFICDEMNGVGFGVDYVDGVETLSLYEETSSHERLEITDQIVNKITDKYIKQRKAEK